jgi:gliding motility-associated-like protein
MNKKFFIYLNLVLIICQLNGYSQINCKTETPVPPLLKLVSVQPETGFTELKWNLSPSTEIAAYIVYKVEGGSALWIDTLWNASATNYLVTNTASKYSSVTYVVNSMRLPQCTSVFPNEINSIFAKIDFDTCRKEIKLTWNNYTKFPINITGYSIMGSVNGGGFNEIAHINPNLNTAIISDFIVGANYCIYVRANLEDGSFSSSNKECLKTRMQRPPQWINADYATVNDKNEISLAFSIDPLSEIKRFTIEKKTGNNSNWQESAQMQSVNNAVTFTDIKANIAEVNSYRLYAVNNCNIKSTSSNIASNIVLNLTTVDDNILLKWNSYRAWAGEVASYNLQMNPGSGFIQKTVVFPPDTSFVFSYREIMNDVTINQICFYITALEKNNPYNINGQSFSSHACTEATEVITVPNIFTPGNDLKNDLFRPVLSFTPKDYRFIITDRQGKVLFESTDPYESWDGISGSTVQSQNVCLWYLRITTPSGKNISKTGTITLLKTR